MARLGSVVVVLAVVRVFELVADRIDEAWLRTIRWRRRAVSRVVWNAAFRLVDGSCELIPGAALQAS